MNDSLLFNDHLCSRAVQSNHDFLSESQIDKGVLPFIEYPVNCILIFKFVLLIELLHSWLIKMSADRLLVYTGNVTFPIFLLTHISI